MELQQPRLRDARHPDPQSKRRVLWRLSPAARLQTARNVNGAHHQRNGHTSKPRGRISCRQKRPTEKSGLGIALAQHDGRRCSLYERLRHGEMGRRTLH